MKNYQSIGKRKDENVCCPSGETHKILIHMGGRGWVRERHKKLDEWEGGLGL